MNSRLSRSRPTESIHKASVIDLGSNSVKMANYNVDSKRSYKPYHQESVRLKLAEGLVDGTIDQRRIDQTIEVLKFFRNIIDFEQINYEISVATSAVREAENRSDLLTAIQNETGFIFRVLSEREEALYSYAGAARSLNLPNIVFFDIGGGSLELVSSQNFEIKRAVSLPLGALRLSQKFTISNNSMHRDIADMSEYINYKLPNRKRLGIDDSNDLLLVGVGGTLRALVKYYQDMISYPLKKLHNYQISYKSINRISNNLYSQSVEDITKIDSIGNGRADTIKAGVAVVSNLMTKLNFDSLILSAQGIREGTLALSLQYPDEFARHEINESHVQDLVRLYCQPDPISAHIKNLVDIFVSLNIISDEERELLALATLQIDKLSSFRTVDSVFYAILDDDSILSHREQLIVALSIIYVKKKKQADILFGEFDSILNPNDKKTIKRISFIVSICDILHKTRALVKPRIVDTLLLLDIYAANNKFPEKLFVNACNKMSDSFKISIKSLVHYSNQDRSTS